MLYPILPALGVWGAPQQVGGETASALAPSSSHPGPEAGSAGQSHMESVHGAASARSSGESSNPPPGIDDLQSTRPSGLLRQAVTQEGSLCPLLVLSATSTCLGGASVSCRPSGWGVTSQWPDPPSCLTHPVVGPEASLSLGFFIGDSERLTSASSPPQGCCAAHLKEKQQTCPVSCGLPIHRTIIADLSVILSPSFPAG